MLKLSESDIEKLSSPSIIVFIATIVRNILQTQTNNNQDKEDTQCSDRTLPSSTIVKDVPILYEIIARTKLKKMNRANEVVVSMKKLVKVKKFNFRNKLARYFLAVRMAYVPGISNSSAALFIPYIIDSFLTEIGHCFNHEDISSVSPFRMTLSNIIEESSVTCILDLIMDLSDNARTFI